MIQRIVAIAVLLATSIVAPALPAGAHTANCHSHGTPGSNSQFFYSTTGWASSSSHALGNYTEVYVNAGSQAGSSNLTRAIDTNWINISSLSLLEPMVGVANNGNFGLTTPVDRWVQFEYWGGLPNQVYNFGPAAEGVLHSIETYRTAVYGGGATSDWTTRIDGYPVRYVSGIAGADIVDVAQGFELLEYNTPNVTGDNYDASLSNQKYLSMFGVWVSGWPGGIRPSCVYPAYGLYGSWGFGAFNHGL